MDSSGTDGSSSKLVAATGVMILVLALMFAVVMMVRV